MGIIMNNAILAEFKRAVSQTKLVGRLALLAYFYFPLSFKSPFFGMNYSQFSYSSKLSIWLNFETSIPILSLSLMFLKFNVRRDLEQLLRTERLSEWMRRTFG